MVNKITYTNFAHKLNILMKKIMYVVIKSDKIMEYFVEFLYATIFYCL